MPFETRTAGPLRRPGAHARGRALGCAALLLAACPAARATDAPLERLGPEHGLSHNSVNAVVQGPEGFLWIGTAAGLDRWDGHEFVHYPGSGDAAGRAVTALAWDDAGRLWTGTTAGLSLFDPAREAFAPVDLPAVLQGKGVAALVRDGPRMWAAVGSRLLAFTRRDAPLEAAFAHAPDEDPRARIVGLVPLPGGGVLALLRELRPPRSAVLVASPGGAVARFDLPPEWGSAAGLHREASGRVWLDPWHAFEIAGTDVRPVTASGGPAAVLPSRVCPDEGGRTWFASDDGFWLRAGGEVRRLTPPPAASPWQGNLFLSCHVDRGGIVWVGSLGGLFRWDPHRRPFHHFRHDPRDPRSLAADPVSSVAEDGGALWLGSYGGGLGRLDPDTGAVTRYRHAAGDPASLCDDVVWSLARAEDALWIGTESGLCRYDLGKRRFSRHAVPGLPEAFSAGRVKRIARQADGVLWLGTNSGLFRYDPSSGAAHRYGSSPAEGVLASRQVGDLLLEEPDVLWVASTDGHLQRLPLRGGEAKVHLLSRADGAVEAAPVYHLARDASGTLWAATHAGLARFDATTGTFRLELGARELPGPVVYSVVPEGGRLWLGTNRGLVRVALERGRAAGVRAFDLLDGVGNVELNRHAALRLRDGTLAFGGMTGLTLFRPEEIRLNPHPPPVALTAVRVLGDEGERSLPPRGLPEVALTPRDHALTVEFAALGFTRAERSRYAYRLDGFDPAWIDAGTRRLARYTNLPAGRYRLHVKAANDDGVWNEAGVSLPVVVFPPLWETWPFRAAVLLLLAGALALAYHLRVRHLLALERVRLRIASDLHDDLASELSGIALASSMLGRGKDLPPGDRERLADVQATSTRVLESLRDIVWTINPEHDSVTAMVDHMKKTAAALLGETPCTFEVEAGGGRPEIGMAARRELFLVFKELIHNVARHARAGRVTVSLRAAAGRITLRVADDGAGFDPDAVRGGEGLRSLRRRAARMGAALETRSRPGAGTEVTLVADLARTRDGAGGGRGV